ncbi:hypothetical protein CR513_29289, partial [Mucuna pruriens]
MPRSFVTLLGLSSSYHLVLGTGPISVEPYKMTTLELVELNKQLKELLEKQFMRASVSPCKASVLLVKKDWSMRFYVDYRQLNKVTIKNRYALPTINGLMDQLVRICVFYKIDLRSRYHQIHIKSEDILKIAFRTCYGHYEYMVMSFGVTNAPSVFMGYMNKIFNPYLNSFIVVFIDDILVYSKTREEHAKHLRVVLQVLKDKQLYAKMLKCDFLARGGEFPMSYYILRRNHYGSSKIEIIVEWEIPRSILEIWSFLRLVGYYKRFIEGFSELALPLTWLTHKDLKKRLAQTLVLVLPNPREPIVVYCDASKMGLGRVLMKGGRVVIYATRQLKTHEKNYPIDDLELAVVVFK